MEARPLPQVGERWWFLNEIGISALRLQRALDELSPGSVLADVRALAGGVSATTLLFSDTSGARFVARKPGRWRTEENPEAAALEHMTLDLLFKAGLKVPRALWLEVAPDVPSTDRFFVMEYVEGMPCLAPDNPALYLQKYASELVHIHNLDFESSGLGGVRRLKNPWRQRGEQSDDRLQEERIRRALESHGPTIGRNAPVLRHADFWPGNVLWRENQIVSVVDWENVCIGEPLDDVAICRLDLLWVLGWDAMEEFTRLYLEMRPLDVSLLAYHDLVAALRPANYVEHFATAYGPLGRPDVTVDTLVRDHREFVNRALDSLNRAEL